MKKIIESIETSKDLFLELSKMNFEINKNEHYSTILIEAKTNKEKQ
ncbi:hypothetical protein OAT10_00180 [Luminiphilus sp.]|nr:hypothetical protein [Luminiphilus sp.]